MEAISPKFDFTGRRVLLSGGVKGLCDTYAKRFLEHNAKVFVMDMDELELGALKKECPGISTLAVNMRDWKEVRAVVEGILPIHHLVCDAPMVGGVKKFLEYEAEDFDGAYDANLRGLAAVGQTVARGMIENKIENGTIVTISSISARNHLFGTLIYGSSKAGFESMTKFMAYELAPFKIRVNCIRPGMCNVAKLKEIREEIRDQVFGKTLARHIIGQEPINPEEIADAVVALSTTLFPSMTGAVVAVDAGFGST